jgi:translation initiation factor 3 subunit B
MFVEYDNEISAQEAVSQLNGYRLDKSHTFKVNFFSDFERYQELSLNTTIEGPAPYKNPGNLQWWLAKPGCYDQFCLLHNDIFTSVYSNTPNEATLVKSREKWTDTRFQWSPKGTYLATFHDRGIALWVGEEFNQFMRFAHQNVQLIDFSPCENYLVTCNPNQAGIDDQALIIWCVRSGQKQRSFTCERTLNLSWPYFRWNSDDKYFARLMTDNLLVYETEVYLYLIDIRLI